MMNSYYRGEQARRYNQRWRVYTERTLAKAEALLDVDALQRIQEQRAPRMLDIACGTGLLLQRITTRVPGIEAYGLDASTDMLEQAQAILPHATFVHADLNAGGLAHVPCAPHTFDLITCTNALHDIADPAVFLTTVKTLLAPGGQFVIEDFTPRHPRLLWTIFERLLQRVEMSHVRALTLAEARASCEATGLHVHAAQAFPITRFWHGWVIHAISRT